MAGSTDRGRRTTSSTRTDISSNITTRNTAPSINSNAGGTARIASGLNVVAGIWLILAPWILDYSGVSAALWNDTIVGILVACLAAVRLLMPLKLPFLSWINLVLGVWLIIAPFALPYSVGTATTAGVPFWNDIILGAAIVILSLLSADSTNNTVAK